MKEIKRDFYLNQLIKKDGNGQIKVITGIRRCGKSYLLKKIFYQYLLQNNDKDHIIYIPLDIKESESLLDGNKFIQYIRTLIKDEKKYYLLLDEIQKMDDFVPVLNTFLYSHLLLLTLQLGKAPKQIFSHFQVLNIFLYFRLL